MTPIDAKLRGYAERYCWDIDPDEAPLRKRSVILRVMDLCVFEDLADLEQTFTRQELSTVLASAPAGAMRPRSWSFWHYRLNLIGPGEAPPAPPARTVA